MEINLLDNFVLIVINFGRLEAIIYALASRINSAFNNEFF